MAIAVRELFDTAIFSHGSRSLFYRNATETRKPLIPLARLPFYPIRSIHFYPIPYPVPSPRHSLPGLISHAKV